MTLPDPTPAPPDERPSPPATTAAHPVDQRARLPLSALAMAFAGLLAGYALSFVGGAVGYAISSSEQAWQLLFAELGLWTGMVGAAVLASRTFGSGDFRRDFGLRVRRTDPVWGLGGAAADWVAATVVSAIIVGVFGTRYRGSNSSIVTGYSGDVAAVAIVVLFALIGAPIVEELFFRGLVQRSLEPATGTAVAIVIQGLVFGGIHVTESSGSGRLGLWLSLSAVGVVHGVIYAKTRRLPASMWTHMLFNASNLALILAAPK